MFGFGKKKTKVFVGLSGGVDSAVAAALLQKKGYDVVGVFIKIVVPGYPCTAGVDRIDAMRVAAHLRIPFLEVDFSKEYEKNVFKPSIAEFSKGRTPNPDVLCNREIKFGTFFEFCKSHGADFIATGHYAGVASAKPVSQRSSGLLSAGKTGRQARPLAHQVSLLAGVDSEKDQSYFLWSVSETVLRYTLTPVGGMQKEGVRAYAKKIGLPNAERPDSQGLCFLGPISTSDMLKRELKLKPGNVLSEEGKVAGTHGGAARYTLGARHGFTLFPAPRRAEPSGRRPHFVVAKDITKNTITVSTSPLPRRARKTEIVLRETNWIGNIESGPCEARFRYRQKLVPAEFTRLSVVLHEPHFVPEGQSLVLYRGQRCLGGGIVESATLT